jgi:hypothetical protein
MAFGFVNPLCPKTEEGQVTAGFRLSLEWGRSEKKMTRSGVVRISPDRPTPCTYIRPMLGSRHVSLLIITGYGTEKSLCIQVDEPVRPAAEGSHGH